MAYDIHIHEENIAVIRFKGKSDAMENERAREEIMQICRDTGIRLVLSDWKEGEVASSVSTMNLHQFGCTWDTSLICCIAIVLPFDVRSRRDINFSKTVAYNRGVVSNVFEKMENALCWLNEMRQQ